METLNLSGLWKVVPDPEDRGLAENWPLSKDPREGYSISLSGCLEENRIGHPVDSKTVWTGSQFGKEFHTDHLYKPYRTDRDYRHSIGQISLSLDSFKSGRGSLVVSSMDFSNFRNKVISGQLLAGILAYMRSDNFNPEIRIAKQLLKKLFKECCNEYSKKNESGCTSRRPGPAS